MPLKLRVTRWSYGAFTCVLFQLDQTKRNALETKVPQREQPVIASCEHCLPFRHILSTELGLGEPTGISVYYESIRGPYSWKLLNFPCGLQSKGSKLPLGPAVVNVGWQECRAVVLGAVWMLPCLWKAISKTSKKPLACMLLGASAVA